jgi:nucleotide-binding universal stress UspA family protein
MKIVYATDGSEGAATAGRLLAGLPLPQEAQVTVLSAVPDSGWVEIPPSGADGSLSPTLPGAADEEERAARDTAERAADWLRERGISAAVRLRRGNAARALLDQAREDGAELVVVGAHGMSALERLLIGSVSERVARHAHCSVLVARSDVLRHAILAVDGSESADHAIQAFIRLPLPAGLEVTVMTVVSPIPMLPPPTAAGLDWEAVLETTERERRAEAQRLVDTARERLKVAGRESRVEIRSGTAAEELVAAARETGADLIAVGAENRSALGRLFLGSVSGRVLSHAPCSVLVARSGE